MIEPLTFLSIALAAVASISSLGQFLVSRRDLAFRTESAEIEKITKELTTNSRLKTLEELTNSLKDGLQSQAEQSRVQHLQIRAELELIKEAVESQRSACQNLRRQSNEH